jgi:hypothetical protein
MVISPLGNLAVVPLALMGGNQAALVVLALVAGVPLLLVSFAPSVRAIRQSLEAANEAAEPVSVHDGVLGPEAVGV